MLRKLFYLLFLVLPSAAQAASESRFGDFQQVLDNLEDSLFKIGVWLAVLFIIISGAMYITSGSNPERAQTAKRALTYSIIGFIVVISYKVIKAIIAGTVTDWF